MDKLPEFTVVPGSDARPRRRRVAKADARPTRSEAKMLTKFCGELEIEIDMDNPVVDIAEAIVTEAVGVPTAKLSAEFQAWLAQSGCAIAGEVVARREAAR